MRGRVSSKARCNSLIVLLFEGKNFSDFEGLSLEWVQCRWMDPGVNELTRALRGVFCSAFCKLVQSFSWKNIFKVFKRQVFLRVLNKLKRKHCGHSRLPETRVVGVHGNPAGFRLLSLFANWFRSKQSSTEGRGNDAWIFSKQRDEKVG